MVSTVGPILVQGEAPQGHQVLPDFQEAPMLQDLEVVAKVVDWDALEAVDLLCFLEFAVPLVPVADQSHNSF